MLTYVYDVFPYQNPRSYLKQIFVTIKGKLITYSRRRHVGVLHPTKTTLRSSVSF